MKLWNRQARLDYHRTMYSPIIDGDTMDFVVDLGFYCQFRLRMRLADVDTAEIFGVKKETEEYKRGMKHKEFVENWMPDYPEEVTSEWPVYIQTERATGKYGRWIGDVWRKGDDKSLTEALQENFDDIS